MSDLVVLLMSSRLVLKPGAINPVYESAFLAYLFIRACMVVMRDDIMLWVFSLFLLYTKKILTMVMLARIIVEEINRIMLIRVRKNLLLVSFLLRWISSANIPIIIRKRYENDVKNAIPPVLGRDMMMVSAALMRWMKCV